MVTDVALKPTASVLVTVFVVGAVITMVSAADGVVVVADYGLTISDLNVLQRGPHFTLQPDSTVVVGKPKMAQLECVADAHPAPTYKSVGFVCWLVINVPATR